MHARTAARRPRDYFIPDKNDFELCSLVWLFTARRPDERSADAVRVEVRQESGREGRRCSEPSHFVPRGSNILLLSWTVLP